METAKFRVSIKVESDDGISSEVSFGKDCVDAVDFPGEALTAFVKGIEKIVDGRPQAIDVMKAFLIEEGKLFALCRLQSAHTGSGSFEDVFDIVVYEDRLHANGIEMQPHVKSLYEMFGVKFANKKINDADDTNSTKNRTRAATPRKQNRKNGY